MYVKRNPAQPSFKPGLSHMSNRDEMDEIQIFWHLSQRHFHFLKVLNILKPNSNCFQLEKKHNKVVYSLRDLAAKFECQYWIDTPS